MQVTKKFITRQNVETSCCPRCEGLLVYADHLDMLQGGYYGEVGRRCVNCGYLTDTMIMINQQQTLIRRGIPKLPREGSNSMLAA